MQTVRGWKFPTATPSGSGGLALFDNMNLLVARVPKHNFLATRDPLGSDDLTQEYYPGSTWVNTINNSVWVCSHNTTSSATWVNTLQSSGTGWSIDDMGNAIFASISNTDTITAITSIAAPTLLVDSIAPYTPGDINLTGNLSVSGSITGTIEATTLSGTLNPSQLGSGSYSSSTFLDGASAFRTLAFGDIPDLSGLYITPSALSGYGYTDSTAVNSAISTALSSALTSYFNTSSTIPVANGGTGTATPFTSGSIIFAGGSGIYNQDNSHLYYDATNHYLGVGTIPSNPLDIRTNAINSAGIQFLDAGGDSVIRNYRSSGNGYMYFQSFSQYVIFQSYGGSNSTLQVEGTNAELRLYGTNNYVTTGANALHLNPDNTITILNGSLVFTGLGSTPTSPTEGQTYFNSVDKHVYCWNGTAWKQLDN